MLTRMQEKYSPNGKGALVWVCQKCGGKGRKLHEYLGRCLTQDEVERQKKSIDSVVSFAFSQVLDKQ